MAQLWWLRARTRKPPSPRSHAGEGVLAFSPVVTGRHGQEHPKQASEVEAVFAHVFRSAAAATIQRAYRCTVQRVLAARALDIARWQSAAVQHYLRASAALALAALVACTLCALLLAVGVASGLSPTSINVRGPAVRGSGVCVSRASLCAPAPACLCVFLVRGRLKL
jgi:hypothetical protein